MPIKLDQSILACALFPIAYLCAFPCWYLTLAPETAEETYVEISDTEPEDPMVLLRRLIQTRGRSIPLPYNFQPTCLAIA